MRGLSGRHCNSLASTSRPGSLLVAEQRALSESQGLSTSRPPPPCLPERVAGGTLSLPRSSWTHPSSRSHSHSRPILWLPKMEPMASALVAPRGSPHSPFPRECVWPDDTHLRRPPCRAATKGLTLHAGFASSVLWYSSSAVLEKTLRHQVEWSSDNWHRHSRRGVLDPSEAVTAEARGRARDTARHRDTERQAEPEPEPEAETKITASRSGPQRQLAHSD